MVKKEDGAVLIVEAAIVFPIVFFTMFFIICMGNAYYIRSCMDSIAQTTAVEAANYASNENLLTIMREGYYYKDRNVDPYRYTVSQYLKDSVDEVVKKRTDSKDNSILAAMLPKNVSYSVKFDSGLFGSSVTVEIDYTISVMPLVKKNLGIADVEYTSRAVANITDSVEFIRNLDMLRDFYTDFTQTETGKKVVGTVKGKIEELVGKINSMFEFFKKKTK